MKQTNTPLSVGYTLPGEGQLPFVDVIRRYRDAVGEVYFAFPGVASGRSPLGGETGFTDFDALACLVEDLTRIREMGVKLHLLFNGACNGGDALSVAHQNQVYSIMDYLDSKDLYPEGVTTTSPVTAQLLKKEDPKLELRASVNMRIGSIKGIQYVEHLFDSFCVSKDVNREPETLAKIADYLHSNGKKLSVLANSGCLRNCSMQSFHDNAVAHEAEIRTKANIEWAQLAGCREYFSHPENYTAFLQNTWIRPEDVHHYDGVADVIKLATRMLMPGGGITVTLRICLSRGMDLSSPPGWWTTTGSRRTGMKRPPAAIRIAPNAITVKPSASRSLFFPKCKRCGTRFGYRIFAYLITFCSAEPQTPSRYDASEPRQRTRSSQRPFPERGSHGSPDQCCTCWQPGSAAG